MKFLVYKFSSTDPIHLKLCMSYSFFIAHRLRLLARKSKTDKKSQIFSTLSQNFKKNLKIFFQFLFSKDVDLIQFFTLIRNI